MIKGIAKLTFKDSKTGHIIHEEKHENALTPALERIYAGDLSGTIDYSKVAPLFSRLLGGCLLFNGSVNASDVFLPKAQAATLTAHAGQNPGTSDPDPKRGSPNIDVSGPIENGYKWTWQWSETRGNGRISHIVLTHADTGDYWNESQPNSMADYFEPVEDICVHNLSTAEYTYQAEGEYENKPQILNMHKIPIAFEDDIDHIISFDIDYDNHRINVYRSKFTGSGVWLWNECGEPYEEGAPVPFNVTHYQWGTWERLGRFIYYLAYDKTAKKLYAITLGQPGTSSYFRTWYSKTAYIDELNLNTGATSSYTIDASGALDSSEYLASYTYIPEGSPVLIKIVNGSVFIPICANETLISKSLRINLSNHNDMEIVNGLYMETGANYNGLSGAMDLGNDRIFYDNNYAAQDANGDYIGYEVKRDNAAGSVFGTGTIGCRVYACEQPTASPVQYLTYAGYGANTGTHPRGTVLNKLYAATVYTLSEPVNKTANMTCTVEYSLIQTGGDES